MILKMTLTFWYWQNNASILLGLHNMNTQMALMPSIHFEQNISQHNSFDYTSIRQSSVDFVFSILWSKWRCVLWIFLFLISLIWFSWDIFHFFEAYFAKPMSWNFSPSLFLGYETLQSCLCKALVFCQWKDNTISFHYI